MAEQEVVTAHALEKQAQLTRSVVHSGPILLSRGNHV
jgi:hypothetical protein